MLHVKFGFDWPSGFREEDVELSLIGHFTYRYIGGKYCDISIFVSIYNINIQIIFQQSV